MFKSTIVFALALLSVADGKRILRGEKKERTQQEKRQFTLSTKDKESEVFQLKPGQEISPRGIRRLLAEDKQQRNRRELRGANGGSSSGSGSGSSSSDSSDEPAWFFNIDDLANLVTLTGMSGEIINFVPAGANPAPPGAEGICSSTSCIGVLAATAEGYDCDPDGDEFEDTCLDVVVADGGGGGVVDFRCPEATDVMRIQTATCVCTGNPATGACTASTTLLFGGTSYAIPAPVANTCATTFAISATLVCESVIAGSSSSTSTSGSSTGSSGSSTGKSSSTSSRRQ